MKEIIQSDLNKAVDLLRAGGLVAFPTETVYGLGGDANNPQALQKIFAAKQRPIDHPLIVHLADISQLAEWAVDISPIAMRLAKTFWPGPLTLILKKAPGVLDLITGGQVTIGLRIPRHPVAQALLKNFGSGLAAPSANRFGRISPTTAQAVAEELNGAVDLILEGGQCEVGVESTIVDVSGVCPVLLRPGMITSEQLQAVLQETVLTKQTYSPRVSGSHESHYAPVTRTRLVAAGQIAQVLQQIEDFPVVLLVRNAALSYAEENKIVQIVMPSDPKMYAHDLYQTLREIDKQGFREIIIEEVSDEVEWSAVRDRLQRASR